MKKQPINADNKKAGAQWVQMTDFEIIAEIGSAICLPDSKKYKIKIAINDFSLTTEAPLECKENYCRWSKRFDATTFSAVYTSVEDLEKIFIYLMDGDSPVCYWKGMVKDFQDPNPQFVWLPFTGDLSIGTVSDQSTAGML